MIKNSMKAKLNNKEVVLGAFVSTPSPSTVEMLGWLGMDYVVIDCEHSVTDYETAENMVRAADLTGITPIVRAGLNLQQNIQRYLDAGVQGVLIPLVNNAEDAKNIGKITKFITPAKFSSCFIADDKNIPNDPNISPEKISAGSIVKYPEIGGIMFQKEAINKNA